MPQIFFGNPTASFSSGPKIYREGDNIEVKTNLYESEYDDLNKGLFWRIIGEGAAAQFSSTYGYVNRSTRNISIDALYNSFENNNTVGSGNFYDLEFAHDRLFQEKVESLGLLVMDTKPPGEKYTTAIISKKRLTEGEAFALLIDYQLFESQYSHNNPWNGKKIANVYYRIEGEGGIDASDFDNISLTDKISEFTIGDSAILTAGVIGYRIANDQKQESSERFRFLFFEDQNLTLPIFSTNWVEINDPGAAYNDTSTAPASTINVNGDNNGIANNGTINNSGTINTGTQVTNISNDTFSTTNTTTNTTVTNNYVYYNSNNTTTNTWNTLLIDNSVKIRDVITQWFPSSSPIPQSRELADPKFLDVAASTWSGKVKLNSVAQAASTGSRLDAPQVDFTADAKQGSLLNGDDGDDQLWGKAGWDVFDGGKGNDLIRAGNGRDILTGGSGADELHGDFGWNTYKSEKDGFSDLIAIKSDQHLSNWLYGKAGNNPNGEKADIIEGLDANDKIRIIGVFSPDITVRAGATAHGVSGIGIYAKGALEALYTGGDLSVAQLTAMTSGDGSAAAMANQVSSYGWTGV